MGFSTTKVKLPKVPRTFGKVFYSPEAIATIIAVHKVFESDENSLQKTSAWMNIENPNLGGIAPYSIIAIGKADKLFRVVVDLTNGNVP